MRAYLVVRAAKCNYFSALNAFAHSHSAALFQMTPWSNTEVTYRGTTRNTLYIWLTFILCKTKDGVELIEVEVAT